MQLRLDGTHAVTPLVQTPFSERNGEVSPDGRWLAYEANDSGRFEIYVRPFPDVSSGHWQVSTDGGTRPLWARNSQELFYLTPTGALMRVGVARGPTWAATAPTKLFEGRYGAAADLRRPDVRRVARRPAVSDDQAGRLPGRDRRPGQLRRRPALGRRAEAARADEVTDARPCRTWTRRVTPALSRSFTNRCARSAGRRCSRRSTRPCRRARPFHPRKGQVVELRFFGGSATGDSPSCGCCETERSRPDGH